MNVHLQTEGRIESGVLLEVDDLKTHFRTERGLVRAVDGVTFSLERGKALGVVGESGSGKTVLSRSIMGLLPSTAVVRGSVRFAGQEIVGLDQRQMRHLWGREMSMIFQNPMVSLNPVMKIGKQIIEPLEIHLGMGRTDARETAIELLREVRIPEPERRLDQYPHELSGGLLQRVMIAAMLLPEPRLVLADEPTTALDVTTQSEVMAILDELRRERGTAMLFITHDLELAGAVCDRTAVMYAGQIVERRASSLLHVDPLHPYTAALGAARPEIDRTVERLFAIPGRPVSAFEAPEGCAFAPRCAYAQDRCRAGRPPLEDLDGGQTRCVRAHELHSELAAVVHHG